MPSLVEKWTSVDKLSLMLRIAEIVRININDENDKDYLLLRFCHLNIIEYFHRLLISK